MAVSSLEYSSQFDHTPFYWCFRIVHAPIFLCSFASDRRHMKDPGNWIAEPLSYEPIVDEDKIVHNLNEYIEIGAENIATNVGAELINDISIRNLVL